MYQEVGMICESLEGGRPEPMANSVEGFYEEDEEQTLLLNIVMALPPPLT